MEQFTGTDGKSYRNVFYVGALKERARIWTYLGDDPGQSKEVRNVGWFSLKECTDLMRDYHQEKKAILIRAHAWLRLKLPFGAEHATGRWRPVMRNVSRPLDSRTMPGRLSNNWRADRNVPVVHATKV